MKKIYLAVLMMSFIAPQCINAQSYPGYRTSNYTGVNGVFYNPANIADSRYRFDINLFAISAFVGNDQASLGVSDLGRTFNGDSLKRILFGGNNGNLSSLVNLDIYGPSVMFNLNRRMAMALTTRARVFSNTRNIDGNLAQSFIDGGEASTGINYPVSFSANNSVVNAAAWSELGFSLSSVLSKDKSRNFFKGGFSVKYLLGTANAYLGMQNLNGTVDNSALNGTYLTGTTGNITINTTDANFNNYKFDDFFKFNGHGVGADLGLVYEYRPESMTKENSKYVDDRFANKYKIKIGLAVLDIGKINFNRNAASSAGYSVNIPAGQQFLIDQFKGKSISEYKSILDNSPYFTQTSSNTGKYAIVLPTTMQLNLDYNVNNGFYVNAAAQLAFSKKKNFNLYAYNSYTLTPRYETRVWGIALPINYSSLSEFNVGLSLRAGPFFIGSGSAITALLGKSKQADIHMGFHIGFPYKKKLRPDTDKDGIFDDVDKCPTVYGIARYEGCPIPDTDGDSINDEEDKCPTVPGVLRYQGCPIPDTDGDGVNDEVDKCPTVPGVAKYNGCPIPDTDKDGVNDEMDKCPTVPGLAKYNGCPPPDRDGDGVNDDMDLCPDVAGPASSKGCPPEQIALQITAEFKNILFDFNKATIRPESMTILTNAAKVMNEEIPNSTFYIDGYTDNIGSVKANKLLSQKRAQSVANALIAAGVTKDRITARGFGKDNPVCDNKTKEGQQCNRRVEVTIRNINQQKKAVGVKIKQ